MLTFPLSSDFIVKLFGLRKSSVPAIDQMIVESSLKIEILAKLKGFIAPFDYFQKCILVNLSLKDILMRIALNRMSETMVQYEKSFKLIKDYHEMDLELLNKDFLNFAYNEEYVEINLPNNRACNVTEINSFIDLFDLSQIDSDGSNYPNSDDILDIIDSESAIVYSLAKLNGFVIPILANSFNDLDNNVKTFYKEIITKRSVAILNIGFSINKESSLLAVSNMIKLQDAIIATKNLSDTNNPLNYYYFNAE